MKKVLAVALLAGLLCGGCALFGGDEASGPAPAAPADGPAEAAKAPEKAPAKAPEKAAVKAAPASQSRLEADLYKTGQSLVGRASRTVVPSKAQKEVRKVGKEYVATYVDVDTNSLNTEVRKGARGYVGFIRYSEHVYECRGASKSAALSAPCEKVKTRNLNEMIRYDGKKWQY